MKELGKVYGYNSDGVDANQGYMENNSELYISSVCLVTNFLCV